MKPKISVIVPVYNAELYIRECLDSILASDIDSLEIIAINDGSKDSSYDILKEYEKDHGIVIIDQPNAGASAARNAGLDIARGEYIGFVDADDWIEPEMYRLMYEKAVGYNADIVACNMYRNQTQKMRKYIENGVYGQKDIRESIYPLLISNLNENVGNVTLRGAVWMRIFRKSIIDDNSIRFDTGLVYNEDGLFCIQATLCSNCYYYMGDDYLYHQRYVADSLTKRYIPNLWNCQKRLISLLYIATNGFSYNFSAQIGKKFMEIAIYCIENECKNDSKLSETERTTNIRDIINDPELLRATKRSKFFKLKNINKAYWLAIVLRSSSLAKRVANHREKKHKMN